MDSSPYVVPIGAHVSLFSKNKLMVKAYKYVYISEKREIEIIS
jgi:hypothetical protein